MSIKMSSMCRAYIIIHSFGLFRMFGLLGTRTKKKKVRKKKLKGAIGKKYGAGNPNSASLSFLNSFASV